MSGSPPHSDQTITPGSWIGVLGGGQLGRMLTHAAQRMGYHVAVFEPELDCPAAQAADRHFYASDSGDDTDAVLHEMARLCDVVTLEFENIDSELVRKAGRFSQTHPSADFLEVCQNRILEKTSLAQADFPVTPFEKVTSVEDVLAAGESMDWPIVLKTATSGYDGKGQALVKSADDAAAVWENFEGVDVIAEKWIPFEAEVSMITARNRAGQMVSYPLLQNSHANHILDVTRCPVSPPLRELESSAEEISQGIAESFGVIGLFCVEFFVTKENTLLINEMAPRPHNSGHLTIEAFSCSQFEQQVRAICNLPLVPASQTRPAAMANLLGDIWSGGEPDWPAVFAAKDAHLHLYGKSSPRDGRKMGHITVLDESSSEARITARELRDALRRT